MNKRSCKSTKFNCGIKLYRSELSYDFKHTLFRLSKQSGLQGEALKVYSFDEKENEDWMNRVIDIAIKNIKSKFGWAVVNDKARFVGDNIDETEYEYDILFTFDNDEQGQWIGSSADIMNHSHLYVLDCMLADWFVGNEVLRQRYEKMSESELSAIRNEVDAYYVKPIYYSI